MTNIKCTGPRYNGETLNLVLVPGWHGKYGHLNALELDHDSACTGYGKHNRVVAFCPDHEGLYCRVDHVWNLRQPSPCEVLHAAIARNGYPDMGRAYTWEFERSETHADAESTDFYFKKRSVTLCKLT